jgi:hypothetical protein
VPFPPGEAGFWGGLWMFIAFSSRQN